MENSEIVYMAGFFDGEGCIGLNKTQCRKQFNKRLEVQITQVDKEPLVLFKKYFGGSIHLIKRNEKNENWQNIYHWIIADKKAENCLKVLSPYLIVKKEQAELALKFRKLPRFNNVCNINNLESKVKEKALIFNNNLIEERKKIYGQFKQYKAVV